MARLWRIFTQFARKRTAVLPALALIAIVVGVGLLFPTKAAVAFDPGNWIIVAIADVLLFFASLIGNITLTLIGLLVFNFFYGWVLAHFYAVCS